jgi:hypothetical protein
VSTTISNQLKEGPLSQEVVLSIIVLICRTLDELHQNEEIHGGIHADNIYLSKDGNLSIAEPIGPTFGINEMLDSLNDTEVCSIAPEVWSSEEWSRYSDIYALGSLSYLLITGNLPFESNTSKELVNQIKSTLPLAISTVDSSIPLWINGLIMRMLNTDPRKRFRSCGEIINTIEAKIQTQEVELKEGRVKSYKTKKSKIAGLAGPLFKGDPEKELLFGFLSRVVFLPFCIAISVAIFYYSIICHSYFSGFYKILPGGIKYFWWILLFVFTAPLTSILFAIFGTPLRRFKGLFRTFVKGSFAVAALLSSFFALNIFMYNFFSGGKISSTDPAVLKAIANITIQDSVHAAVLSPFSPEMTIDKNSGLWSIVPSLSKFVPIKSMYFPYLLAFLSIVSFQVDQNINSKSRSASSLVARWTILFILLQVIAGYVYQITYPLPSGQVIKVSIATIDLYLSKIGLLIGFFNLILIVMLSWYFFLRESNEYNSRI